MMRRFGTARTASLKKESVMAAFRNLALVCLAPLALLDLRCDTDAFSDSEAAERLDALVCHTRFSTRCMIEIRYAYPAADLSVVPQNIYF
jgi:hypothetical protein